jgi:hypothetical protein
VNELTSCNKIYLTHVIRGWGVNLYVGINYVYATTNFNVLFKLKIYKIQKSKSFWCMFCPQKVNNRKEKAKRWKMQKNSHPIVNKLVHLNPITSPSPYPPLVTR